MLIGKTLGKQYRIVYSLGAGGFGHAYLAQSQIEPWCVVKQLQPAIHPTNSAGWQTAKRLFDTEAQTLELLNECDTIPKLYDHFEEDGKFYLVEEFVEGHDLCQELQQSILREIDIYQLLKDILETLKLIQEHRIIHRDISPDNLIRRKQDNRLVLIDFGAVKQRLIDEEGKARRSTVVVGKDAYMPDEQASGRPQFCSDIYAVGIIGIQACIGSIPERDYDSGELIWHSHANISPELLRVLDKMTRCNYRERYQLAVDVLKDLDLLFTFNGFHSFRYKFKYDSARTWYERANKMRSYGYHQAAILLFRKSIDIKPSYYKAWFNLAITLTYVNEYEKAEEIYRHVLKIKPKSARTFLHLGMCLYHLKRYVEAENCFDQALNIQSYCAVAWFHKGLALSQLSKTDDALAAYREAVRLRPSYAIFLEDLEIL